MGADRHRSGRVPAVLEYHRVGRPRPAAADPAVAVVRLAGALAGAAVLSCLTVSVPCVVFAVVGWWFDDVSTAPAAQTAATFGLAAAVAVVPTVACHRRLARPRGPVGNWN